MVAHGMLKKFPLEEELEEERDEEEWEMVEDGEEADVEGESDGEVEGEEITEDEMKRKGRYLVEKILKHKFMNEWKFLVLWSAPYTLKDATWEPCGHRLVE